MLIGFISFIRRKIIKTHHSVELPEAGPRPAIAPLASVDELTSSSVSLDIVEDTFKMTILAKGIKLSRGNFRLEVGKFNLK